VTEKKEQKVKVKKRKNDKGSEKVGAIKQE
jgi:hypothetical protein